MLYLYRLLLTAYQLLLYASAHVIPKAKLFVDGRKTQSIRLESLKHVHEKRIWFHFASLGEFEQGRTLIEAWKTMYAEYKIVITFFSPSGYEVVKNLAIADYLFYLPVDNKFTSQQVVELFNPTVAIFVKYEFWYYYFLYLKERQTPFFVVSAIFRPGQIFFKTYGGFFRKILLCPSWIFVQDILSQQLLNSINISRVSISGDTRFDRVQQIVSQNIKLTEVEQFCGKSPVLIAGSTWNRDERLLSKLMRSPAAHGWKFILAPHEVSQVSNQLLNSFPHPVQFYSKLLDGEALDPSSRILIIDTMGLLSSLYQYGKIAYIGGGFNKGIHNTLEAGAWGLPVLFGPNYVRFAEAVTMVKQGGAFSVKNEISLLRTFDMLKKSPVRASSGEIFKAYVNLQKGATKRILDQINRLAVRQSEPSAQLP